jgi:hypothetical protein
MCTKREMSRNKICRLLLKGGAEIAIIPTILKWMTVWWEKVAITSKRHGYTYYNGDISIVVPPDAAITLIGNKTCLMTAKSLIAWSTILFQKRTVTFSQPCLGLESSLPYSEKTATGYHPESV